MILPFILPFIYVPLLAGLVLTAVYGYLGVFVVDRGDIFASLALTQMAAFGSAVALLLGAEEHLLAFASTLLGAAIFALTRDRRVPRETIAAIIFAVAAAATVLALSQTIFGDVRDMLVGSILSVSRREVLVAAAIGVTASAFLRRHSPDFVFHLLLGALVTASVTFAGVLVVFAYTVVPAVAAALFARTLVKRLLLGWTVGIAVTAAAIPLSFRLDLPTGATIVSLFGVALLIAALIRVLTRRRAAL